MNEVLRRTAAVCLSAVLAAAVTSGCTREAKKPPVAPSSSPPMSAAPDAGGRTASPAADSTSASPSGQVDYHSPEMVAAAFVVAYVRQSWKDTDPRAYLDRIEPYSTAAYVKRLRDTTSDRCNLMCQQARKSHVVVNADNPRTVIPDEAPRTDSEVWVQVSYEERTSWSNGSDGTQAEMVLELTKTGGKWLVNGRQGS